jgi:S-adenosylmethionine hydrolase
MVDPVGGARGAGGPGTVPAVYFLSDYGTADEFVGVVHAVLHGLAPTAAVIDLSHCVPVFDVVAGAAMLVRSGPFLGAGVVLAVVDPGVGTDRLGVALEVPAGGPRWLVGPDNGLLLPLASLLGGVRAAVALDPVHPGGDPGAARPRGTFDGRDVFAPAAAHLASGGDAKRIGRPIEVGTLRPAPAGGRAGSPGSGPDADGSAVRATVTWIDRFGNVQLTAIPDDLSAIGLIPGGTARVTVHSGPDGGGGQGRAVTGRRVGAFGHLARGEFGLLEDANGQVSLVLDRGSAARSLELSGSGGVVRIVVDPGGGSPTAGGTGA